MRPCQGVRGLLWMAQQVTEVAPDQLVQASGRAQPRWAFLFPMREQGRQLAGAGVVAVPVDGGPRQAGQATHAAADQASQQVGWALLLRCAKRRLLASRACTRSNCSWLTRGGISATRIHSSRGASTRLIAERLRGAVAERRSSVPRRCQRLP